MTEGNEYIRREDSKAGKTRPGNCEAFQVLIKTI